ncbi:HD-domain/PDEase-like protein [Coprinopsis marcescibilis]|uniref:Phosphodiesterase n=1 Tax=Coprinopsis marcescibilis TaxID=230819 RepID=A0A5C3KI87_COPMA|nr:HD-domain/PDEase-like protein [Coprinopsis marcescibilis]
MCGVTALGQTIMSGDGHIRHLKRRSADVGGLHLAVMNNGQGKGWAGTEVETKYAELLSDMYNHTLIAVNDHDMNFVPASLPKPTRSRLIRSLDCWHFEPHKLPEEEVLAGTLLLFEALYRIDGMESSIGVPLTRIASFLHHLRKIYRYENTYHNYEHALDVLQATQCYLVTAGLVPPITLLLQPGKLWKSTRKPNGKSLLDLLGLRDIFAIYIAAIGHDVGHPGFTNVFMKNAQTPLSMVFDGNSALEQLHCQLLLRVMRHHGLGALLDDPVEGPQFRKLLLKTVLATDMSVHDDFMQRFKDDLDGKQSDSVLLRKILVSQALIKNADISNPSRPFPVAQHWATALMQEWLAQAMLEEHYQLQHTVNPSEKPLAVSKSQVYFISVFAKPLLDLTAKALPDLDRYAKHIDMNLERWMTRRDELLQLEEKADPKSQPTPPPTSPRQPGDFQSAFPLSLPIAFPTPPTTIAGSVASSDSPPGSPSESSFFSPMSEVSNGSSQIPQRFRSPSNSGSSTDSSNGGTSVIGMLPINFPPSDNEAIRAAGKSSIRQARNVNRNSWCSPSMLSNGQKIPGLTHLFSPLASPLSNTSSPSDMYPSPLSVLPPTSIAAPSHLNGRSAPSATPVVAVAVPVSKRTPVPDITTPSQLDTGTPGPTTK